MAESNQCSTCQKSIGVMHCTVCDEHFCAQDFEGHLEILSTEMEELIKERNRLQENINTTTEGNNSHNEQASTVIDESAQATVSPSQEQRHGDGATREDDSGPYNSPNPYHPPGPN
ncbi:unnamed protein product [Adineta steineri]|uniref:Uncharacterized protein n=1 Tax=Adineta steineri TaxID=433720 RepID=A0A819QWB5_9BILA|nr:unnamed protein product [Adineta steineri]CAF4054373.1 unnamed protein product [Adineta steineri]